MNETNKWHNADTDKPANESEVLLRVRKDDGRIIYIIGFYRGYEYGDDNAEITHYDKITHCIELPY